MKGWLLNICGLPNHASVLVLLFWRHSSTSYHYKIDFVFKKLTCYRDTARSPLSSPSAFFSIYMDGHYASFRFANPQRCAKTLQILIASQNNLARTMLDKPARLFFRTYAKNFRRYIQINAVSWLCASG